MNKGPQLQEALTIGPFVQMVAKTGYYRPCRWKKGPVNWGLTGPILVETFAKTGDEIRRKDEDNTQGGEKKTRDQISFLT